MRSRRQEELLAAVSRSQVVVVSGETGCGKTTQLPQFILEHEVAAGRGASCSIICTQVPRYPSLRHKPMPSRTSLLDLSSALFDLTSRTNPPPVRLAVAGDL